MWAVQPSIPVTKPNDRLLIFTLKDRIQFAVLSDMDVGFFFWLLSASIATYLKRFCMHFLCYY